MQLARGAKPPHSNRRGCAWQVRRHRPSVPHPHLVAPQHLVLLPHLVAPPHLVLHRRLARPSVICLPCLHKTVAQKLLHATNRACVPPPPQVLVQHRRHRLLAHPLNLAAHQLSVRVRFSRTSLLAPLAHSARVFCSHAGGTGAFGAAQGGGAFGAAQGGGGGFASYAPQAASSGFGALAQAGGSAPAPSFGGHR